MTPDRWRQVTSLFHAARTKAPDGREPFLREACRDDPSLVDEILAMLRAEETASPLSRGTGLSKSPALADGATIGPYRVEARIGSGGMGEVYRAVDTRLHRTVALKALAPDLAREEQFRARFEREARLLASLNHPHIGAIYGLETSGSLSVLVLELVEGPTLAERLRTAPLRLTETLRIARQIASALEAAHDKGIVHRDLKPANVKVASDGSIKVLDFGIAKMIAGDAVATMIADRTETGSVFGTPAYMSPEQLRGAAVDKRADTWAFGCVLYEMLTGRHAFAGDTVPDIIARIVDRQPDWEALPADVPSSIRALVRHCLQKDPADRLHDIADARIELTDALTQPDATKPATIGVRHSRWAVALVLLSVAAAVIWFGSTRLNAPTTPAEPIEYGLRFPPEFRPGGGMAVSPDGQYIATRLFGTTGQIWLTTLGKSEPQPIAGTEDATTPFWSADGSQVGFFRRGKMHRVARTGGPVTEICDAPAIAASWNSDDVILFTSGPGLLQVAASGGTPRVIRTAEPGVVSLTSPQFLPDNRHFLFYAGRADGHGMWRVGSLDSDQTVDVMESASPVVFTKPNHVLFVHGSSLVARSLDLQTFQLTGAEKTLVSNIVPGTLSLTPLFSASATTLAFRTPFAGETGQLTWFSDAGSRQESIPSPTQGEYLNPRISPDGGRVALNAMDPQTGNWDIWIWNRARGFPSRLTTDPAVDSDPVWSPDGTRILFASNRGGHQGFYLRSADGSGNDEEIARADGAGLIENVLARGGTLVLNDWSRDGHYIVYVTLSGSPPTIWALPVGDKSAPVQISDGTTVSYAPRLSPDGKWLAYTDGSTGMLEVHVRRFLAAGAQARISHGGAIHPRWIANGRGLTFVKIGGGIAAVDLDFSASGIRVGPERLLTPLPVLTLNDNRSHYDVTQDGHQLLVRQAAGSPSPPVTVVVNWTSRLK
jgi:serine/threonine protein kinase/Tol biopolymer transport system component